MNSLAAMAKKSVEIFYLHAPDPNVPIEETLAEVQNISLSRCLCLSLTRCVSVSLSLPHPLSRCLCLSLTRCLCVSVSQVQAMYEEGKFKQLGLSNYQSWEVAHIYHVCLANGYAN